jgi:ATP-binding cassette subfamily B protein
MISHLQRLSMGFYANAQTGDIVSRFSSDLSDIEKGLTGRLADGALAVIGLAISLPVLFKQNWGLALFAVITLPIVLSSTRLFTTRASRANYKLKRQQAALANSVQETVKSQQVVKVFGLQPYTLAKLQKQLDDLLKVSERANFLSQTVGTTSSLGVRLVQVLVVAVGAVLVFNKGLFHSSLDAPALVAFTVIMTQASQKAYDLTKKVVPSLISAGGGVQRVEELLSEKPAVVDTPDAVALPPLAREIRFSDVSFSYGGERPILDSVNLTVPAGQYVAFVGPSGSGKSTILNLITRFYDASKGVVTFDDYDLRRVTQDSLRAQMAAVFQDTFLFNTTIRENIRLGKLDASDAEIEAAAKAAEIHELIASWPKGYDTPTGEAGSLLSGGQRQRLAIARAILRNPRILILDEPTSALDPTTEASVNETLERLAKNRTVIAVTHRLDGVKNVDRICVLKAGRIVEQGRHDELLKRQGLYHELWQRQHGFEVSADGKNATISVSRLQTMPLFAVPVFANLDQTLLSVFARQFVSTHYEAGTVIAREGQPGDTFYLIVRGKVEVVTTGADGKKRQVAVLEDGDYFAESALFEEQPYAATIRAVKPTLCLSLRRDQFKNLITISPELRTAVDQVIESRRLQVLIGSTEGDQSMNRSIYLRP